MEPPDCFHPTTVTFFFFTHQRDAARPVLLGRLVSIKLDVKHRDRKFVKLFECNYTGQNKLGIKLLKCIFEPIDY